VWGGKKRRRRGEVRGGKGKGRQKIVSRFFTYDSSRKKNVVTMFIKTR
jgi:hypothetical protein